MSLASKKKELSLLVRTYQGAARCAFKPGLEPRWWPVGVPFVAPAKLTQTHLDEALAAAEQAASSPKREDDAEQHAAGTDSGRGGGGRWRKSETQSLPVKAGGKSETQTLPVKAEETESLDVETQEQKSPVKGRRSARKNASKDVPVEAIDADADSDGSVKAEAKEQPAASPSERAGDDDDSGVSEARDDGSGNGDSDIADCKDDDDNLESILNPEIASQSPVPDEQEPPATGMRTRRKKASSKTTQRQARMLNSTAARQNASALPKIPKKVSRGGDYVYPTDEELDAILEDAERITEDAIEQKSILRTLHKQSLEALLESCCDDIMQKNQMILLRMPMHIRNMPADEYILQHGGDPANVMECDIYNRWCEQIEELRCGSDGENAAHGSAAPGSAALGNAKANEAAVVATPGASAAVLCATARRARRRAAAANAAAGGATASRVATRAEQERFWRRGGVAKAVPSRRARGAAEVILIPTTANGSPVNESPGVLAAAALGEDGEGDGGGDEDEEETRALEARLAASKARIAAEERENERLMKKLAQARRKGAAASVRKVR